MTEEEKKERAEAIQKAVDGRNDLVWLAMQYQCEKCHRGEYIYCGVGVEGPEELRKKGLFIASPLMGPRCRFCGGETSHIDWFLDENFAPRDPGPGIRYFRVPLKWTEENMQYFESICFAGDTVTMPSILDKIFKICACCQINPGVKKVRGRWRCQTCLDRTRPSGIKENT